MNDPRPVPPQGLPHTNPQNTAAPRPVQPLRPPIAPPPAQRLPGQPQQGGSVPPLPSRIPNIPGVVHRAMPPIPVDDDVISLEDEDSPPTAAPATGGVAQSQIAPPSKIKFASGGDKHTYTKFKRQTHVTGAGACRIRSFHGRLSDDGLAFMDDKINEWLDNHPEIEVKFVNSLVGPLEGKVTGEQGLIVTVWY